MVTWGSSSKHNQVESNMFPLFSSELLKPQMCFFSELRPPSRLLSLASAWRDDADQKQTVRNDVHVAVSYRLLSVWKHTNRSILNVPGVILYFQLIRQQSVSVLPHKGFKHLTFSNYVPSIK